MLLSAAMLGPRLPLLFLLAAGGGETASPADRAQARDIFRTLIEIDTSQTDGDTTRAAREVAERLTRAGVPAADIAVLGPSEKRGNLVARLHGSGNKPPLLLLAHLDVVDARRSDWTVDPFVFLERDGYFYGRGTQDDKSLVALWLSTVLRLQRDKRALDRDVILALTADEEAGPQNGVQWLLRHHRPLIDAALCLTEGGAGELKGGRRRAVTVQPSEKGYLTFTLEVKDKGGHSSLPGPDNPIVRLGDALARIQRHVFPVELTPVTLAYFGRMSAIEAAPLGPDMRAVARPAPDTGAIDRLSRLPYYNARLRTTCVPTQISGGHAENALPQAARATVNCRVMPGHDTAEIQETLRRLVADPKVQLSVAHAMDPSPPSPIPPELVATIERAVAGLWPGVPVVPIMLTGATDGRFLRAAGIPTYGLTGLFVDIDDIRAHGQDERLLVQSFFEAQDFLYRLVSDLAIAGRAAR